MLARAKYVEKRGDSAFFIRIEDIEAGFEHAFEVGSAESFEHWLGSQGDAWFYLDSVDEARLDNPRTFEKAVRRFSARIKDAQLRAHICISSRPYAWRPKSDRQLIEQYLPFKKHQAEPTGENAEASERDERSDSALEIYVLHPLEEDDIRLFAKHRSVPELDQLIDELERLNLMALAERPFDLEGILAKWTSDRTLDGRSELLRHNIEIRIKEIDTDRASQQPLNLGKAREGARQLAAAVILTGEAGIRVPDNTHERVGINAETVLADWEPGDVQTLLERAIFNDVIYGAVRFRHREVRELLVWQGEMSDCMPPLLGLAADPERGIYARIAATRAVMSCGSGEQKSTLWNALLKAQAELPRKLLAEVVQDAAADSTSVAMLLKSIDKLPPYDRFKTTGLMQALHGLIDRLPLPVNADADQPLAMLIGGLHTILDRTPYLEPHKCRVSGDFAWLLEPATHAVERLVSARAKAATQNHAIAIMLNSLAARDWIDREFDDYKDKLGELIPAWPQLNDCLFWRSIAATRTRRERDGKPLIDIWPVQWPDHYWSFERDSFPRVLQWVNARELGDDRLVTLSLAFHVYAQAGKPGEWIDPLRAAVAGDAVLVARLDELLNPTLSEEDREWERKSVARKQKRDHQRREQEQIRSDWIAHLKANPDLVRNPPRLKPGEVSFDQVWLLREIEGSGLRTNRSQGAAWQSLIDEFGNDVARAFRDAAMAHWRHYKPGLRSEGADASSIPVSLSFAMAGLEIEAREVNEFPAHLGEPEMRHALRYISWELASAKPDQITHKILHDLAYHAPWLHGPLIEPLLAWVRVHDLRSQNVLRYSLHILKSGGVDPAELSLVAQAKVADQRSGEHLPYWYAIWVDADPDTGVIAVADWLAALGPEEGSLAAQLFITALMGNRHGDDSGPNIGHFRTAKHLKSLYVLMHEHIRAKEDINRAGGGGYSPKLRDHAQDARNRLFNLLSEIPGKQAYAALTELIQEHPEQDYRRWMAKRAYKRAEEDGDLEPWTAEQVRKFGSRLTRTPATHRQLFDLALDRLTDMKDRLERGNDSPYRTWQKAGTVRAAAQPTCGRLSARRNGTLWIDAVGLARIQAWERTQACEAMADWRETRWRFWASGCSRTIGPAFPTALPMSQPLRSL